MTRTEIISAIARESQNVACCADGSYLGHLETLLAYAREASGAIPGGKAYFYQRAAACLVREIERLEHEVTP